MRGTIGAKRHNFDFVVSVGCPIPLAPRGIPARTAAATRLSPAARTEGLSRQVRVDRDHDDRVDPRNHRLREHGSGADPDDGDMRGGRDPDSARRVRHRPADAVQDLRRITGPFDCTVDCSGVSGVTRAGIVATDGRATVSPPPLYFLVLFTGFGRRSEALRPSSGSKRGTVLLAGEVQHDERRRHDLVALIRARLARFVRFRCERPTPASGLPRAAARAPAPRRRSLPRSGSPARARARRTRRPGSLRGTRTVPRV